MRKSIALIVVVSLFIGSCKNNNQPSKVVLNDSTYWQINTNATFDLKAGSIEINGFSPSINGSPLAYTNFDIQTGNNKATLLYNLANGSQISISLCSDSSTLYISSQITGSDSAPAYFSPMAFGVVKGADRFYKQGLGFGGPSGVFEIPKPSKRVDKNGIFEEAWSYDSYMTFGLFAPNNTAVAIGTYDNTEYLHRVVFYNRYNRFGLIDRWIDQNNAIVNDEFSTEQIPLVNKTLVLPNIYISIGAKPFETMQQLAKNIAVANKVKLTQKAAYHWCSWYEMQDKFTETVLFNFITNLKNVQPNPAIQTIQIDDGYCKRGDWLISNERFASSLDTSVAKIVKAGYRAGVWIGPFMVSQHTEMFKNHPDWLLHTLDGKPYVEGVFPGNDSTYILDSSNPEAFEYLRNVFHEMRKKGITYFKTDFMDWGLRNSMHWKRHTPGKTSVQYFSEVVRMIRQEIGPESFWLGCICPMPPMVGYIDGIRVANDLGQAWSSYSHVNMIQETEANQYFNNIFWQNDPDVLYLDGFKTQYTDDEKKSIILWNGLLGGIINTSDRFHLVSEAYMQWWQFVKPAEKPINATFPFWDKTLNVRVMTQKLNAGAFALLVLNDKDEPQSVTINMVDVFKNTNAYIFEWLPNSCSELGLQNAISLNLQPHQSKLYYLNVENVKPDDKTGLNGLQY